MAAAAEHRKASPAKDRARFRPVPSAWRDPIGPDGKTAPWLAELSESSGVYMIRHHMPWHGVTLRYVGESHTGALKKTILRHFQEPTTEHQKHTHYSSRKVEVRVIATPANKAVALQYQIIGKYDPPDNEITGETLDLADIPF